MSFQPSPPDVSPLAGQSNAGLRRRRFAQIQGYEIEREIGRGGMATVYCAMQKTLSRQVALKVLSQEPDENDEFAQRFEKEGLTLAQLLHPNIVTIYDIGVSENNQLYLAIEYLSGGTLKERIKLGLSFDSAIHIARSIAKALGYAHGKGVIHRDVKPSNIMFRYDDTPVLTDFGVARVAGSNTVHTATGLMIGSPGYMSPEQARGESATIQSDLYGLGVVLYEMLAGRPLYQGDNPLSVMLKHLHDAIPRLPKEYDFLQPILDKLLAKKTSDRYQNTDEFLKELNSIVPSDTGAQLGLITSSGYQSGGYSTNSKVQSLFKKKSWPFWIFIIGAVLLLLIIVAIYFFRTGNVADTVKTPAIPLKPVEPVSQEEKIATLLKQADAQFKSGLLTDESEHSAEAIYRQVLKLDRGNNQALAGLKNIVKEYERLARQRLEAGALQDSLDQIKKGLAVAPEHDGLMRLRQEVEQRLAELKAQKFEQEQQHQAQLHAEQFLAQARDSLQEGRLDISLAHIEQGLLALPKHAGLLALREQVKTKLAERQRREEAERRQAEEVERQKAEQERQKAERAKRQQEADQWLARAREAQRNGQYAESVQHIDKGLALVPDHAELRILREAVRRQAEEAERQKAEQERRRAEQAKRQEEIKTLLEQAETHWKAKRLIAPAGNNAEAAYRQVLKLDAGNVQAQTGLARIAQDYLQQARQRQAAGALQDSLSLIEKGLAVVPNDAELMGLRQEVERGIAEAKVRQAQVEEQQLRAEQFLAQARDSLQEGRLDISLAHIEQGLLALPKHAGLLALREQVKTKLAERQRREEAERRQAEEVERQKVEQERQKAERAKRQQEADQWLARAREAQRNGDYATSLQHIDQGLALAPDHAELRSLREAVHGQWEAEQKRRAEQAKREQEIKTLLEQAETHWKAKRLIAPAGNNAEAAYRQVLKLDAGNVQAQTGLARIAQDYLQQARQRQAAGALQDSLSLIEKGLAVVQNQAELLRLREEVRAQLKEQQLKEQQLKEQQLKEQQLKEQQLKEQQLKEQQLKEQQLKEQQLKEQQLKEQQLKEQQRDKQRQEEKQRLEQQQQDKQRLEQQQRDKQRQEEKQQQLKEQQLKEQQRDKQRQEEKQRLEQQQRDKQRQEEKQRLEQQQRDKQRQEEKQRLEQQQRDKQRQEEKQRLEQQQRDKQRQEEKQRLEQQRQEQQRKEQPPESQPPKPPEPKPRVFGTF